jgi:hypothetical protein
LRSAMDFCLSSAKCITSPFVCAMNNPLKPQAASLAAAIAQGELWEIVRELNDMQCNALMVVSCL